MIRFPDVFKRIAKTIRGCPVLGLFLPEIQPIDETDVLNFGHSGRRPVTQACLSDHEGNFA
jgi:hypothetical protein